MKPLEIGLGEAGQTEIVGLQNNPRIVEYFAKTGNSYVHDDETSWCAAFVGWCLESASIVSTRLLNARSYLKWGKPTTTPKVGDIVVFWRITPTSPFGHVAFYLGTQKGYVYTWGGNQNNMVCMGAYPVSQVLSYRTF